MLIISPDETLCCPKCKAIVPFSAKYCTNCKLKFGIDEFTPIRNENKYTNFKKSMVSIISIPPLAFFLGVILEALIPGCNCDDFGSNCPSCGSIGGIVHGLKFGGLGFSMFSFFLAPFLTVMK
jgi:hypothetical protein